MLLLTAPCSPACLVQVTSKIITLHSIWLIYGISTCRWYSEEYDSFHLDGYYYYYEYIMHTSSAGVGDAGDAVNAVESSENGSPFRLPSTDGFCTSRYGPWWYTSNTLDGGSCGYLRFFGASDNSGFIWGWGTGAFPVGNLAKARMMIRLVAV